MRHMQRTDSTVGTTQEHGCPAPDAILGRWVNTNPQAASLVEIRIEDGAAGPILQVFGSGEDGPIDWGKVEGELFANVEEEDSIHTVALFAHYDHGFMVTDFQIRPNKGVLVAVHFNVFKDDSGRFNYVARDFFHRVDHPS